MPRGPVEEEPFGKSALTTHKPIFTFGIKHDGAPAVASPKENLKWLLGGKGAGLAQMASIGLPVPPGFTITTEVCAVYGKYNRNLPDAIWSEVMDGVLLVEKQLGRTLGDETSPLLLSVRSGAAISMPGMMDTVLNLGLNDVTVEAIAKETANERCAFDSYRRFLDMFGDVVMGIPHADFEAELDALKKSSNVEHDSDLSVDQLKELVQRYKAVYAKHNIEFPDDPHEQLGKAIHAVFDSWDSTRAKKYRSLQNITGLVGTAVNVQAMVFGNMGDTSGTGVLFTRCPNDGTNELFGEFLVNAQGEDVVAGIRTPKPIAQLRDDFPEIYAQLRRTCDRLEEYFKDMQDVEFTVQEGTLFILQTRNGKRSGAAAVAIAVDMVEQGLISMEEAILQVTPEHLDTMLHNQFTNVHAVEYTSAVIAKGLNASPGAAVGVACFSSAEVEHKRKDGISVILIRHETSPEDVAGMFAADGILTARGGKTSHAAVVARGWGKTCVCGVGESMVVDEEKREVKIGDVLIREGDTLSLNGTTGEVLLGAMPTSKPEISGKLGKFMEFVQEVKTMEVLANADTGADAAMARRRGAGGIGLCRTEHMFFDHLPLVRHMILATSEADRQAAVDQLLPQQRQDFEAIFRAMDTLPVTIRLLDPPLHEFLPQQAEQELADAVKMSMADLAVAIDNMRECNPMLGLRGCRLGITRPEITQMQVRAIIEAALNVKQSGGNPKPKVMIPLISSVSEFEHQKQLISATAEAVFAERNESLAFEIGTMIEVPRAALLSASVAAAGAEFFSYGTNDLTQMTFGFSRDDVGTFLPFYLTNNLLPTDPFQTIDKEAVGQLVRISTEEGRKAKPGLKVGVCGEHGGDPASIEFFATLEHDYVSCSPFRVPVACLAAARAAAAH